MGKTGRSAHATVILALALTTGCGAGADAKEAARYKAEDVNVNQVQAYNGFAARMTKQLLQESGEANVVISPAKCDTRAFPRLEWCRWSYCKQEILHMLGSDKIFHGSAQPGKRGAD